MFKRFLIPLSIVALATLAAFGLKHANLQAQTDDKPLYTRLIGPHTMAFFHARVSDVMKMPVLQAFYEKMPEFKQQLDKGCRELFGVGHADIETITMYVDQVSIEGGRPNEPRPPYIMMRASKPVDAAALKATLGSNLEAVKFGKYELNVGKNRGVALLDDRTVLLFNFDHRHSTERARQELILHFASLETGLEIPQGLKSSVTLAATGKHHAVAGFTISKDLTAFFEEHAKEIPPMMAPFKPLIKLQSGAVTMDYVSGVENDLQIKIAGNFPDEASAKAGMGAVRFSIAAAKMGLSSIPNRNDPEMKDVYDLASKQLDAIKVDTDKNDVVIQYQIQTAVYVPLMTAAIEKVRNAANRMLSSSNMRQLIIAMHNYHADYNRLPDAVFSKNGKPLHSWRVTLLPYMEHDNLYKQIKLDEPWDSEANKKLFESVPMPKYLAHPGKNDGDSKMTYYKVFYTKEGVSPRAGFSLGKPMTLGQMTVGDGTSNTFALIEAGPPVLWYKPDDIEFDPKAQLPRMESPWKDKKVSVGMFDGSVRQVWLDADEAMWKAFITANGGEAVDFSKLEERSK